MNNLFMRILLKVLIGKNSASLIRRIVTWIGAILVGVAIKVGGHPDAEPIPGVTLPGAGDLSGDMSVGDMLTAIIGVLLIWVSRFMSFLRARNLDWVAEWVGPLIGRSVPQLLGAGLAVVSGILGYVGYQDMEGTDLGTMPVTTLVGAVVAWMASAALSAFEDGTRNQVETSPPKGLPSL